MEKARLLEQELGTSCFLAWLVISGSVSESAASRFGPQNQIQWQRRSKVAAKLGRTNAMGIANVLPPEIE